MDSFADTCPQVCRYDENQAEFEVDIHEGISLAVRKIGIMKHCLLLAIFA
jgi:hypothetical protein